jgi:hypothetical protein
MIRVNGGRWWIRDVWFSYWIENSWTRSNSIKISYWLSSRRRNFLSNIDCNAKISSAYFSRFVIYIFNTTTNYKNVENMWRHFVFTCCYFISCVITTSYESLCQWKKRKKGCVRQKTNVVLYYINNVFFVISSFINERML